MKKALRLLVLLLPVIVLASACTSGGSQNNGRVSAKVLVMHYYDHLLPESQAYDGMLKSALKHEGVRADVRNFFWYDHTDGSQQDALDSLVRKMDEDGWVPDVVLTDNDRMLNVLLKDERSSYFTKVPIVAGGLVYTDWQLWRQYPNVVPIGCIPDFKVNFDLAFEFSNSNLLLIELDHRIIDDELRKQLHDAAGSTRYVDNTDLHLGMLSAKEARELYPDSLIIQAVSVTQPATNASDGDLEKGIENLHKAFYASSECAVLTVKKDLYSESLALCSDRPQFTSLRGGFGNGDGRYLCGYFVSYYTVARDQAYYASRIIRGDQPQHLPSRIHEPQYFMDWDAMKELGLRYRDYSSRFTIANAPMIVKDPAGFWGLIAFAVIFMFTIGYLVLYNRMRRNRQTSEKQLQQLLNEREFSDMALRGSGCIMLRSPHDLDMIRRMMHRDHMDEFNAVQQYFENPTDNFTQEMYMTTNGGRTYRWKEFRSGTHASAEKGITPNGIIIDIDENIHRREEYHQAMAIAEDARKKESFIAKISHEIRTPLNSIMGFAQLLSTNDYIVDPEEKKEVNGMVRASTTQLIEMVQDILNFSRMDSGRVNINATRVSVSKIVDDAVAEWQDKVTDNVRLIRQEGRDGVFIEADAHLVAEVLDIYLSNAFKFTEKGVVAVGWTCNYRDEEVNIYVEDSGCGIALDKQKHVFDNFWKDDGFVSGLGLGLTLAKAYTEKMGGKVAVNSLPGVGTRFRCTFKATFEKIEYNK